VGWGKGVFVCRGREKQGEEAARGKTGDGWSSRDRRSRIAQDCGGRKGPPWTEGGRPEFSKKKREAGNDPRWGGKRKRLAAVDGGKRKRSRVEGRRSLRGEEGPLPGKRGHCRGGDLYRHSDCLQKTHYTDCLRHGPRGKTRSQKGGGGGCKKGPPQKRQKGRTAPCRITKGVVGGLFGVFLGVCGLVLWVGFFFWFGWLFCWCWGQRERDDLSV